jgi:hypothetical protein
VPPRTAVGRFIRDAIIRVAIAVAVLDWLVFEWKVYVWLDVAALAAVLLAMKFGGHGQ